MSEAEKVPPAEECEKRCQEFAAITSTDSALAMFYLQDRDWCLDRALNSYFEESASGLSGVEATTGETEASSSTEAAAPSVKQLGSTQPYRIRVLSWNIDGLDKQNLKSRTIGVCNVIKHEDPHVVFLQEVVEETEEIIQELCPLYHMIPGNTEEYYTAILVKIGEVQVEDTKVLPFKNSVMMRNLLSLKDYSSARKTQLQQCFKYALNREPDRTVVFGGDLNLRDKEITEIGGLPEGILDMWEVTGKRPEAKNTWDLLRNDNLQMPGKFQPRCRFDRKYVRHSTPAVVKPEYFELCGIERLKTCQRFCSDHWGLLTHFNILSKVPK
ncbi:TYDP2-like protein [Mya arenaria]|uniref:TYDP2-like protein n=1 Tax=Mya arenaria TaxID=6604 RepID=A0ABY7F1Y9_MYAAR|nr:TYDP2-like protein [Mya arenaria]